jgi:hypothetical protein
MLKREGIKEQFGDDGCDQTASERYGYPVQAHHCISCSVIQGHELAPLAIDSGYDVNNGKNNIFLPARFGHMMRDQLQRHRGGHWNLYYDYVTNQLDTLYEKYKDAKPCEDPEDRKNILQDLMDVQTDIRTDLEDRDIWLYDWSELLYGQDYREEGPGDLTLDNQQGDSAAGRSWVITYPAGSARRKKHKNGQLRSKWYSDKGFPAPSGVNA